MGAGASRGGAPSSADLLESAEDAIATGETQRKPAIVFSSRALVSKESEPAIAPKEAERALVNVIDKISPLEIFAECIMGRCLTVSQIVAEADSDNSGELEAEEWMNLCAKTLRLRLTPTQIMDVFELIDADKSGTCSANEMQVQITKAMKETEAKVLESAKPAFEDIKDERRDTKLIALVAHNNMKPTMMTFVAQHRDFFKTVQIVTTGSTGSALESKLGLQVSAKVASGPLGGDQEIGSKITNDEVAACFFFIDPLSTHPHEADICALTRICEVHNIACATNPATGEALVHAFLHSKVYGEMLYKTHRRHESMVVSAYKEDQKKVITKVAQKKSLEGEADGRAAEHAGPLKH